ncbi:MAG: ATP-binding protein [Gemmatimonadetes bacterium]|nr:ATP-binding protein [Gemmatimonadota bacterium]MCZ6861745.1 ATP-binding protein [Alphaproteobacteria bacterium]
MSIDRGDFDAVSEQDLHELVTAQVPEGLRVEYKLETYGNTDSEKREFLKDVSALANSQGGHLILGMEETAGVATAVVGLGATDADAELLRLEQIARGGLEPRISGLRLKAIPLTAGGHAILLRVPRSWNPPHRVVAQGSNRFFVRHSAGVHEPDVEELRTLFSESASALDQARQFRAERLEAIRSGIGQRPLVSGGRIILHILPVASLSGAVAVDVEQVRQQYTAFPPIGSTGMTPSYNYHGFINERGGDENYGYTQIFRNGALEATKANIIRERDDCLFIPGLSLERQIFEVFSQYIIGLRDVGVPPPLIIMLTFEGVLRVHYVVGSNVYDEIEPPLPEDVLTLPECVLEDYGEDIDHHRAVRPAFDALWNSIGYPRSRFFNDQGLWIGEVRQG